MHSNFSCLCSHGLYFSFLHFTLVRCMIQSRTVAGSTRSPNPSPTTSGFIADKLQFAHRFQFQFACPRVSNFLYDFSLLASWFSVCLRAGFRFAYQPVPVLLAGQFRFTCQFLLACSLQLRFSSHYQPIPFYCQPVLGTWPHSSF